MAVSKRLRFEVFKRDLFTCRYCGRKPPAVMLEVDHVVARASGGGDEIDNLVTSCQACNSGKSDKPLERVVPPLDEMEVLASLQEVLERKRHIEQSLRVEAENRAAEAQVVELVNRWWSELVNTTWTLDQTTLPNMARHLDLDDFRFAIERTASFSYRRDDQTGGTPNGSRVTKYFYKVCWSRIKELDSESGAE